MSSRAQLVCQQMENISSAVLENYQHIIKQYVRKRNGVYALYKRDRLYYVGLATNLKSRLGDHLKDRHRGLWDRFSVYLTIGDHHIRELEALLLRIARPAGNLQKGRFAKCENLNRRLAQDIKAEYRDELASILGKQRNNLSGPDARGDRPVLAPYVSQIRRHRLRGRRKDKSAKARVRTDGSIIIYGLKGESFDSPSMAAHKVLGHNANGWEFWHYERSPGEWVPLARLRD